MTIGYNTETRLIEVVRTPQNTSFETMVKMAIAVLKNPKSKDIDLTKMENALLNLAKQLDKEYKEENK